MSAQLKDAETFYAERVSFDQSEFDSTQKSLKFRKFMAISGWSIASIAIGSLMVLLPMKEFVPITVLVDKTTGASEVVQGKFRVNMEDPKWERMQIADLTKYVRAREGFTRGEAETNYMTVYLMSDTNLRGEWDAEYRPERNPRALLNTITNTKDRYTVTNISVSFLPSSEPNMRVAQVHYDKERHVGAVQPTTQRFISTITYTYDPANVPTSTEGIMFNPLGFTAKNYRRDKQSEETPIPAGNAQPGFSG